MSNLALRRPSDRRGRGSQPRPTRTTPKPYYNTNNNSGMLNNNTFRDMNNMGTQAEEAAIRPHATSRLRDFGTSGEVYGIHNRHAAPGGEGGMSEFDLLQAMLTGAGSSGSSGGGGRGRGGGGGGGPAGPTPEQTAAYAALLETMQSQANPYAGYADRLAGMFDPTSINERYDRAGAQVAEAGATGRSRVNEVSSAMRNRTAQAGRDIDRGFSNRISAMQQLAQEMQKSQASQASGLGSMLAANGVAGGVGPESAALQNLHRASVGSARDAQNMFAQSMRDRQELASGLQQDVGLGMSQQEQALLNRIATDRATGLQNLDSRRIQAEADAWLREQEWAARQAQEMAALRLQAAQLGITLPGAPAPGINAPATVGVGAARVA